MAYTQAPTEMDMYMKLPKGIELGNGKKGEHILKLLANLYKQKQVGCMWNQHLVDKLLSVGFKQSQIDECVFYHDNVIFIVYVDNGLFLGPSDGKLKVMVKAFKKHGLDIEDQGHPNDHVDVNMKKHHDRSYEFSQLALIDTITLASAMEEKSNQYICLLQSISMLMLTLSLFMNVTGSNLILFLFLEN